MQMSVKNKIIYNKTYITYNIIETHNIPNLFLNYLSIKEIEYLKIKESHLFKKCVFIHMIHTIPEFRNQHMGTKGLIYFRNLCNQYPILLFCENNYQHFDLVKWYKSLGFMEIYSNLESTLFKIN